MRKRTSTPPTSSQDPLAPPPLPMAKRLNRNALIVAAVVMGMTALAAMVTMQTKRSTASPESAPSSLTTGSAAPSFLDMPLRQSVETLEDERDTTNIIDTTIYAENFPITPSYADETSNPWNMSPSERQSNDGISSLHDPIQDAQVSYRRALRSPITVATNEFESPRDTSTYRGGVTAAPRTDELAELLGVLEGPAIGMSHTPSPNTPVNTPVNASDSLSTMNRASPPSNSSLNGDVGHLRAGTVISTMLLTAVNSELPGQLLAQVTRNVYDSRTQQHLMIPKGTRLVGRYDSRVTTGQQRLLVVWTRLLFADGRSVTLPEWDGVDATGATGLAGSVDNHRRQVFGNALLLSAITAGIQLSQPQHASIYAPPNASQVAGGAVGQQLGEVATEMIRRNMEIRPTITLEAGTPITVFVRGDLDLPSIPDPAPHR